MSGGAVRLVLFDIDGTLLWSDGAGRRAIHAALREVFGSIGPADHWFDGKTDRQIVRELMRHDGHDDAHIDARMEELLRRYVAHLDREMRAPGHDPRPLPGVVELLDALDARDDVALGLLTGNLEAGARVKLAAVGIDFERFVVGAFGSDHEHRPELPAIALRRAAARLGRALRGADVWVVGDTPADLTCGLGIGARALGVATGRYSVAELRAYEPAAVVPALDDTDAVLEVLLG